ncbi:MAG TPA: hypothetical protein PLX66_00740 [Bacilli bacterium]|nr:hypothetical protein [Bacilli bacterium]
MENDFKTILNNAIKAGESTNNIVNSKKIIEHIQRLIRENEDIIAQANQIDIKNNNGPAISFDKISKVFKEVMENEPLVELKEAISISDNIAYSKVYSPKGLVSIVYDGNPYALIYCSLMSILTHNITIFTQDNYSCGLNNLLLQFVQTALSQFGYNKNIIQINYNNAAAIFDNFTTIDFTIIIGNRDFQNKHLKLCHNNVMCSGYDNYDVYIDDELHIDFIKKMLGESHNSTIYLKNNLNFKIDSGIYVNDVDEAAFQIKHNGSKYCTVIFTGDNKAATEFIKGLSFSNVFVNADCFKMSLFDINQRDLLKVKTIILPSAIEPKANEKNE